MTLLYTCYMHKGFLLCRKLSAHGVGEDRFTAVDLYMKVQIQAWEDKLINVLSIQHMQVFMLQECSYTCTGFASAICQTYKFCLTSQSFKTKHNMVSLRERERAYVCVCVCVCVHDLERKGNWGFAGTSIGCPVCDQLQWLSDRFVWPTFTTQMSNGFKNLWRHHWHRHACIKV